MRQWTFILVHDKDARENQASTKSQSQPQQLQDAFCKSLESFVQALDDISRSFNVL